MDKLFGSGGHDKKHKLELPLSLRTQPPDLFQKKPRQTFFGA